MKKIEERMKKGNGSHFAHAARAAPEWSPAIKALLRKRRFWSPGLHEALGGHFGWRDGASEWGDWDHMEHQNGEMEHQNEEMEHQNGDMEPERYQNGSPLLKIY